MISFLFTPKPMRRIMMRIRRPKMRKICEDGTGGGIGSGVVVVSNVVVLCVAAVDVVVLVVLLVRKYE